MPAPALECPLKTPEAWHQFVAQYAGDERWLRTCEDSTCDGEYYDEVRWNIARVLAQCKSFLDLHPSIDRCTSNLRKFTRVWMQQHDDSSYGFAVDNHVYLSAQEAPDKPPLMMRPPKAIVSALHDEAKVEKAARDNGWKYLTHDSGLGGYRTFVLYPDPGGKFDLWMLLNLSGKGKDGRIDTKAMPMSVIAVQKKNADGTKLKKVKLHFRDYQIREDKKGYHLVLFEGSNGKCYSCHASGMRTLIPRRTPVLEAKPVKGESGSSDFAYERLMELNRKIRSYGAPDWDGNVVPADHGPILGKSQGCTDCHDGQTRGVLNLSTSHAQMKQKLVAELSMPPDASFPKMLERSEMKDPSLSAAEAAALTSAIAAHQVSLQDFENSRGPALRNWLLDVPCR
jgi:hypothetical protein